MWTNSVVVALFDKIFHLQPAKREIYPRKIVLFTLWFEISTY